MPNFQFSGMGKSADCGQSAANSSLRRIFTVAAAQAVAIVDRESVAVNAIDLLVPNRKLLA
jgi:hypothetical protein